MASSLSRPTMRGTTAPDSLTAANIPSPVDEIDQTPAVWTGLPSLKGQLRVLHRRAAQAASRELLGWRRRVRPVRAVWRSVVPAAPINPAAKIPEYTAIAQ